MEPTSSAELFATKNGKKAVDVILYAHLVREPVNIFSNNTGKSYRFLEVHAASSRGDLIKVTFWNDDIDRLSPQLRQGALLRFKMFKAQKVTSHKFRVGTFDVTLCAQRDSSVSVVTDKFSLKQLPLSNLCDIDMTVSARHRLCFEIPQKFVSHDNDQGLIGYGTLYDANWSATNVTAQIVLRQNAPLLRYILGVKNRVIIQGTDLSSK
ncbi:hypothetical protein AAVH_14061 [Aphelenchoides avenae]|nr:hypothetical protein AAVH_14061 [Aphelenchus avenae]